MNKMGINELNNAWISAGQKVDDLNAKMNAAVLDDSFNKEDFKDLKDKRDNLVAQRDAIKDQLDEARALEVSRMNKEDMKPLDDKQEDVRDQFVKDFKNMVTSGTTDPGNGGLTIPTDIQYAIRKLVRQFASLQGLVNVESVTTTSGSRVYEKLTDIKPLANLDDEAAAIGDNEDPELTLIKYAIKRYAGITTITNSLLKDTVDNIIAWLSTWIARKVVITRNLAILEVMNKASKKPTITKFDDIKDLALNTLDPAINATSSFLTNQSGFAVLAKVKDADGRYMLQCDPVNQENYRIEGKAVTVIADKWLPDIAGAHPIYFGDLKQGITLFDRENMSLMTTNTGAGAFEHDLTKIRVIDRFDVEQIDDGAYAVGSFKTVANQPATTPADSGKMA
ncbi:phage major head protein [Limosilactobacillus coleohominis DSM 14060]|nr:phage major head protein [Limosilactobacillus coleohominis DSM 14060]